MTQAVLFAEPAESETSTVSSNLDQGYAAEQTCLAWLLNYGVEAVAVTGQKKSDIWIGHKNYLCRMNVKSSAQIKDGMVRGLQCGGRDAKTKIS